MNPKLTLIAKIIITIICLTVVPISLLFYALSDGTGIGGGYQIGHARNPLFLLPMLFPIAAIVLLVRDIKNFSRGNQTTTGASLAFWIFAGAIAFFIVKFILSTYLYRFVQF